jgi:hypothetical protein
MSGLAFDGPQCPNACTGALREIPQDSEKGAEDSSGFVGLREVKTSDFVLDPVFELTTSAFPFLPYFSYFPDVDLREIESRDL